MDINWISLSPYERTEHIKKNKCFTCHKTRCQPWKHSRIEGGPWITDPTRRNPSWGNSPLIITTSPRAITIPVELYKTKNRKILEIHALIDSGATISCINSHLVRKMKWPLKKLSVTVEDPPIPFSPLSPANCTMLSHFSFNDFIAVAFLDLAGDLDIQI